MPRRASGPAPAPRGGGYPERVGERSPQHGLPAQPPLQLGDLGQQQLAGGDRVGERVVGGVARQAEGPPGGVQAQRATDLVLPGWQEPVLQGQGVDRGHGRAGAERRQGGLGEEAQLERGMVREQDPAVEGAQEARKHVGQARRVGDLVVGEPVEGGGGSDVHLAGRADRELAGPAQHDLPADHRHPPDGEEVVGARVEPGRLDVEGEELHLGHRGGVAGGCCGGQLPQRPGWVVLGAAAAVPSERQARPHSKPGGR